MELLNKLYGFLDIEDKSYTFVFETSNFNLQLFPTKENWLEEKFNLLGYNMKTAEKDKWIPIKRFEGVTAEGYSVLFFVSDMPSINNGVRTYPVQWAIYHSMCLDPIKVKGVRLRGGDIDRFFPSIRALDSNVIFGESHYVQELSVTSKLLDSHSCGKYRVAPHIDACISVKAFSSLHTQDAKNPITAKSSLLIDFSDPVEVDIAYKSIMDIMQFLRYTCYRNNVFVETFELYWPEDNGTRRYDGFVLIPYMYEEENDKSANGRIITYDFWQNNVQRLLTQIKHKRIGFQHICDSIKDNSHYSASRMLLILAAFEREYRNIYGIDYLRSDDYLCVKTEMISLLKDYSKRKNGKSKKYVKNEIKHIQNSGISYSNMVLAAISDCKAIMKPFIQKYYSNAFETTLESFSTRVGKLRNDLAHSNLNIRYEPIILRDIKVMEELIYAMRLKKYNSDQAVQEAINALFGEKIRIH